jgi:hypothetical protein
VEIGICFLAILVNKSQNCCVDCQADVKVVTNNQVLLEKIELKEGTTTTLNTNVYVSYRSGNAQKFWTNVAIATAGVAVSTQLNSSTPIGAGDSKVQSSISPIVPLSVSVATLPGIWKNRPRGVPDAGLWLQHRDKKGKLLETWEQPISQEAKNGAELLTVAIEKPLTEGTLEVYLQNGSKNGVYYWGLQTVKNVVENASLAKLALPPKNPNEPSPNGQGWTCSLMPDGSYHCVYDPGKEPDPNSGWELEGGNVPGVTVTEKRNHENEPDPNRDPFGNIDPSNTDPPRTNPSDNYGGGGGEPPVDKIEQQKCQEAAFQDYISKLHSLNDKYSARYRAYLEQQLHDIIWKWVEFVGTLGLNKALEWIKDIKQLISVIAMADMTPHVKEATSGIVKEVPGMFEAIAAIDNEYWSEAGNLANNYAEKHLNCK